MNKPYVDTCMY